MGDSRDRHVRSITSNSGMHKEALLELLVTRCLNVIPTPGPTLAALTAGYGSTEWSDQIFDLPTGSNSRSFAGSPRYDHM